MRLQLAGLAAATCLALLVSADRASAQEVYFKAPTPIVRGEFGRKVDFDGDTAVVRSRRGTVYVYENVGGTWITEAILPDPYVSYVTGEVSISGDRLAVGHAGWEIVRIYERSGGTWSLAHELSPAVSDSFSYFGVSLELDGDRLIVGDRNERGSATQVNGPVDDQSPYQGAAYVFEYQTGVWNQAAYLKASNGEADDHFGASVAIDGDWAVVGATGEWGAANTYDSAGAAYVFRRNAIGNWQERAILRHPEPTPLDYFGTDCAIDGGRIVVSVPREDSSSTGVDGPYSDSANNTGAAFVFDRTGSQWNQTGFLKHLVAQQNQFGARVTVAEDRVFVSGSHNGPSLYEWVNGSWHAYTSPILATYSAPGDMYGGIFALHGDQVFVGAPWEDGSTGGVGPPVDDNGSFNSGSAHLIDLPECLPIETYCTGAPNSLTDGATLTWSLGSSSLAANDFKLVASGMPSFVVGGFLMAPNANAAPFGDGVLCLSGGIHRIAPVQADGIGVVEYPMDWTNLPGGLQVQAGDLYRFQLWYRDPGFGTGLNTTDGIRVMFCP